ncbi:MAG: sporulation protein [Ruminococcaceae bacterium]|nr:sporulation protein [Oscillospiraceae bacterium]
MRERGKIGMLVRGIEAGAVLTAAVGLLVYGETVSQAGRQAVNICLELLIPSLFPFFVVSGLILSCGWANEAAPWFAPLMKRLFGVNGACAPAFLLGLIGGYPVGARTAIALYRQGTCTKEEAERLLAFCNNSGPAFILGAVGTGILGSARAGILLYAAHILAGISVGVVFRFWKGEKSLTETAEEAPGTVQKTFLRCFLDSVRDAGTGVMSISLFVIVFSVLIALLLRGGILTALAQALGTLTAPLGLDAEAAEELLTGFLEVTAGLRSLADVPMTLTEKMAAASCMLGWAGLCVHCQVLSFLQGSGLSARPYLLGKLTQGALATLYIRWIVRLFPVTEMTGVLMEQRLERLAAVDTVQSLYTALIGALAVLLWVLLSTQYRKRQAKR